LRDFSFISGIVDSYNNAQKRKKKKTSGVSHRGLAIYIEKYLKAKEEL
jgi:hypothetical protein